MLYFETINTQNVRNKCCTQATSQSDINPILSEYTKKHIMRAYILVKNIVHKMFAP